ncbi:MAG: DUF465 domain-containing protein [Pseudomonadota bacterium]
MDDAEFEALQARIADLESEHRDLDDAIIRLAEAVYVDQMQIQRMKRRKLALKDQLAKLRSRLIPDLNA